MKVTKIDFQDAEALTRLLSDGKKSRERFNLEINRHHCGWAIMHAMTVEAASRGFAYKDTEQMRVYIREAAKWLTDANGKYGLMLLGLCGNGKTTMARAIANIILKFSEKELGYGNRKVMKFYTAKQICDMAAGDDKELKRLRELANEEMMIIDELGEEPLEVMIYGNLRTPMVDLLAERYDKQKMTIVTTNLGTDQLEAKYKDRIYDRFKEMFKIIKFENESYRAADDKMEHAGPVGDPQNP